MNVLMIGPGFAVKGGISSVVRVYWASDLATRHQLTYVATHRDGSVISKLAEALRGLGGFLRTIVLRRVDIVHIHTASRASFYRKSIFVLLAALFRKKIILHVHGGEFMIFFFDESGPLKRRYIRFIFGRADRVIALSESWRANLARVLESDGKVVVVPNPVLLPDATERRRRKNVKILYMGRLGAQKGVYDLITAADLLAAKYDALTFVCCGDGELNEVRSTVRERRLDDRFLLPGWISDTEPYYRDADVFVLPSYNECMPMSILEAAGYGLPVVATRVGGVPDMMEDGVTGFLVAPGEPDALRERLERLVASPALRRRMGDAARARVMKRYDAALIVAQLDALYAELMMGEDSDETQ